MMNIVNASGLLMRDTPRDMRTTSGVDAGRTVWRPVNPPRTTGRSGALPPREPEVRQVLVEVLVKRVAGPDALDCSDEHRLIEDAQMKRRPKHERMTTLAAQISLTSTLHAHDLDTAPMTITQSVHRQCDVTAFLTQDIDNSAPIDAPRF